MFDIFQDAPYSDDALIAQLGRTKKRFGIVDDLDPQKERDPKLGEKIDQLVKSIYGDMSIIDGKVGALTQASSVLLVVASIALGPAGGANHSGLSFWVVLAAFLVLFVAVIFCVSVVHLFWYRFDHPTAAATDSELKLLLKIRNGRSIRYRIGWLLTVAGGAIVAFAIILFVFRGPG